MSQPIRIGIIGCGRAAERLHQPALARIGAVQLTAVADPRPARAELLAQGVAACRVFASGEELLESGCVDAVVVANPPGAHVATAQRAVACGVSALVEKPLSTSIEGLEQLEKAAAESPAGLMMGFNRRHWEPAQQLRRLLSERSLERARARMQFTINHEAWGAVDDTVDPLHNLAPHHLDLARYVFDREITTVRARWLGSEAIEMALTLTGEIVVQARAAHAMRYEEWIRVQLEAVSYRLWSGSQRVTPAEGPMRVGLDVRDALARRLGRRLAPLRRSYEEQMRAFIASVRGERRSSPGLSDGIAAVRVVDAARRSAAAGGEEVRV